MDAPCQGERSPRTVQKEAALGLFLVGAAAAGWGTWTLFLRGSGIAPSWQSILILLVVAAVSLPRALRGGGRPHPLRRRRALSLLLGLLGLFHAGRFLSLFPALPP